MGFVHALLVGTQVAPATTPHPGAAQQTEVVEQEPRTGWQLESLAHVPYPELHEGLPEGVQHTLFTPHGVLLLVPLQPPSGAQVFLNLPLTRP